MKLMTEAVAAADFSLNRLSDESDASSRRAIAAALEALDRDDEALELRRKLITLPRATAKDFSEAGYLAARLQKPEEVHTIFAEAFARFPKDESVRRYAGWSFVNLGESMAALQAFEASRALLDDPNRPDTDLLAGLAIAQKLNGNEAVAIATYQKLIETGRGRRDRVDWAAQIYRDGPEITEKEPLEVLRKATLIADPELAETLLRQLEEKGGLEPRREAVELLREVQSYKNDDNSRYKLATALGNLAWELVISRQFAEAQAHCEEAQGLVAKIGDGVEKEKRENLIFIQANLAHALLFQGKYEEALAIYRRNWDKPRFGETFGELAIKDFPVFDEAGLTHPDLSRMKQALEDLRSKAPSP